MNVILCIIHEHFELAEYKRVVDVGWVDGKLECERGSGGGGKEFHLY